MRKVHVPVAIRYNILAFNKNEEQKVPKGWNEPQYEISNNVVSATSKASDQPAHMRSLIRAFASCLNILWLLSYWPTIILKFLSLKEASQAYTCQNTTLLEITCHRSNVIAKGGNLIATFTKQLTLLLTFCRL